jgi:hypothetical protein
VAYPPEPSQAGVSPRGNARGEMEACTRQLRTSGVARCTPRTRGEISGRHDCSCPRSVEIALTAAPMRVRTVTPSHHGVGISHGRCSFTDWSGRQFCGRCRGTRFRSAIESDPQLMNFDRKPLRHSWYLPQGFKAAVVMTGDDHANGGTAGRFDAYMADSAPGVP